MYYVLCTFQLQWYGHVTNFRIVFLVEFIHLVSSEANEICNRQLKKTILPEHVFQALQVKDTELLHTVMFSI